MKVRFYAEGSTERVDIRTGFDGRDVVSREATEEDKRRFSREYAAFKPPPAPRSTPKPTKKTE